MESVLLKLASEAPGAVAMLVIVIVFLRHMTQRDAMIERLETRCSEALTENARALEGLKTMMSENAATLSRWIADHSQGRG